LSDRSERETKTRLTANDVEKYLLAIMSVSRTGLHVAFDSIAYLSSSSNVQLCPIDKFAVGIITGYAELDARHARFTLVQLQAIAKNHRGLNNGR